MPNTHVGISYLEIYENTKNLELQFRLEETRNRTIEKQIKLTALETGRNNGYNGFSNSNRFDLGRAFKLIPPFQENNVDEFLASFERLANRLSARRCYYSKASRRRL